jgi:hypothetical protein
MNNIGSINSNEMLRLASNLNLTLPEEIKVLPNKVFIKIPEKSILKNEMRNYINFFQKYKLSESSKFCCELLHSLNEQESPNHVIGREVLNKNTKEEFLRDNTDQSYQIWTQPDLPQSDILAYLSSLYDCQEYKKCAYFAQETLKKEEKQFHK